MAGADSAKIIRSEDARIPNAEIMAWDLTLFESSARHVVADVVDIDIKVVAEEVKKRKWPHEPPPNFAVGTRCVRFWDPTADNTTGAQIVKDGIRVYTPHDNGFKSWRSLLGAEFCEEYTSKSMAPFLEDTTYCHSKDEYWRFFRNDPVPHYEKRTENSLTTPSFHISRRPLPFAKAVSIDDNALALVSSHSRPSRLQSVRKRSTSR